MEPFIKNPKLLDETIADEDLLDFSIQRAIFGEKINRVNAGLIGLVADFGKGKSTLIHQVKLSRQGLDEKWIDFEAWDMPERRELWEGFVLTMARNIDPKTFEEVRKSIDGTKNSDKKTLVNTLGDIPGLAVIKNLNHFLDTSPARRVFEIQEILIKLINEKCKESKIIVVAEDIDRSGPNGIFFIETLKSFIKNSALNKQIVVITPIAEKSFFDNQESYLKCLDIIEFLDFSQVKLHHFFEQILAENLSSNHSYVQLMSDFFERLMIQYPDTTLRKVKLILRKAMINYELQEAAGFEPDWRVTILFTASRFFKREDKTISYFDEFKQKRVIPKGLIFAVFLAVVLSQEKNYGNSLLNREGNPMVVKYDFKLMARENDDVQGFPSAPWFNEWRSDEPLYYITDFYLNY